MHIKWNVHVWVLMIKNYRQVPLWKSLLLELKKYFWKDKNKWPLIACPLKFSCLLWISLLCSGNLVKFVLFCFVWLVSVCLVPLFDL